MARSPPVRKDLHFKQRFALTPAPFPASPLGQRNQNAGESRLIASSRKSKCKSCNKTLSSDRMIKRRFVTFQQIPLEKMERGLVKAVATLRLEPWEISGRLGVRFRKTRDDLDELDAALIQTNSGFQFALVRHYRQPQSGTDILINEKSPNLKADLCQVLDVLPINLDQLHWMHPVILPALSKPGGSFWDQPIEILEEALSIRKAISVLQERLSDLLSVRDVEAAPPHLRLRGDSKKSHPARRKMVSPDKAPSCHPARSFKELTKASVKN